MNLLLIEPDELTDRRVRLTDRRAEHARAVWRVSVGDRIRVGVLRGRRGVGVVRAVGEAVELDVDLPEPACPAPAVDVVLAVPRPKALRRVLHTVGAMGARRIDLVNAWRVDKAYFGSPIMAPAALRHELRLGCEQGATTWLPTVDVHPRLMPWFDRPRADGVALVLHPHARAPIETALEPGSTQRVVAAIGPEGGWIDRELATFNDRGFRAVALGDRVLRTDTAVAATLAQIALLRRLGASS